MKELPNPYEDILEPEEVRVGPRFCRFVIVLFLLVCTLPPLGRHWMEVREVRREDRWLPVVEFFRWQAEPGEGLVAHLRAFEDRLEDAPFHEPPRQFIQGALLQAVREGNTKTLVSPTRRLFLRPSIEGVTGTGPLEPPPLGAASDPALKSMLPPLPVIVQFAQELRERNVELLFVPVPVKAMIEPDALTGRAPSAPLLHPDQAGFLDALRAEGILVIDPVDLLFARRVDKGGSESVFLDQDTHWRPDAMEAVASAVADEIRGRPWFGDLAARTDPGRYAISTEERSHIGDLVENLDLPAAIHGFNPETVILRPVRDEVTGERPASDPGSPVVLLGDSFVNIFDDPSIGFGREGETRIGAGFAQHLAAALGLPLDVIAVNGQAATGVRRTLAKRPGESIRGKKAVVWLIASRDLLYTPKLAAANQVEWQHVDWLPDTPDVTPPAPPGELEIPEEGVLVEATLLRKAPIPDPRATPYAQSLYETLWGDVVAVDGGGRREELPVQTWAFRDRTIVPSGRLETGRRYRFHPIPAEAATEIEGQQIQPLEDALFLDLYFADSFDPAPER